MAALAKPDLLPVGIVKTFGDTGPMYEVLGPALDGPKGAIRFQHHALNRRGTASAVPLQPRINCGFSRWGSQPPCRTSSSVCPFGVITRIFHLCEHGQRARPPAELP